MAIPKKGSRNITVCDQRFRWVVAVHDNTANLVAELAASGVPAEDIPDHITSERLATHMYSADVPDPDLLIRTSGEARLSGFLLWQSAYAEFVFVDVFWPAFRRIDFLRALREFSFRERRFGK